MFVHVARTEGVSALWSGVLPTLLMSVPSTMMYFTAYDELKERLEAGTNPCSTVHALAPLIAGGVARAGAATVVSPLELARTKMQAPAAARLLPSSPASHPAAALRAAAAVIAEAGASMRHTLAEEIRSGGWRSLWRGVGPTLWRDVPFSMAYWLGYERIRQAAEAAVAARGGARDGSIWKRFGIAFAAGAGSGSVAAILTTPFDVVKTRVQLAMLRQGPGARPSTSAVLRAVLREEGPAALMAGVGPRVAKVAPACAIMISSYEVAKRLLADRQ